MSLLENVHFQAWVDLTVYRILSESPCALDREWSLTYMAYRHQTRRASGKEPAKLNISKKARKG